MTANLQNPTIDVRIVDTRTLTVVAYVPRWKNIEFSDQLSDVGSGKLVLDYNDAFINQFETTYGASALYSGSYAVQILRGGTTVFTFLIEDADVQRVGYAQETVIAGRGIGAQLDWAIVLPENYSSSMAQVNLETSGQQLLARELRGYEFLARAATTTNLSAVYSTDSSGVGQLTASANGAFPTLDGLTDIVVTDTILVKNQTNTAHNGVYYVDNIGSGSTKWVLTRVSQLNFYEDRYCYVGARVFVNEGTANGQKAFQIATCPNSVATEPGLGTTPITFTSASSVYTAVGGFYILFTEADTGDELSMRQGASWGTVRTGYGRGGTSNKVAWALSLDSTLNSSKGLTDSKGSTPKDGGNVTIDYGRTLLELIQTVCDQTECHWHVSPTGVISIARKTNKLYSTPFGTNRTSGSSAVMLPLPASNSTQTKTSARDLRSVVFASNNYLIDSSQDSSLITTYGRREGYYTNSGNDNEAVSNVATTGLSKVGGLTFGIDIDFIETTGRQAFIDFVVGDMILVEYDIGTYESRIVSGISMTIDSSMQVSVQLTLEAVIADALVKLQTQSIYGNARASTLRALMNEGNERVAHAYVRTTPVSSVEGMSNRVEVSWSISGSSAASGYEAVVYRTDSLNRVSAISRTSNVATITVPDAHGLQVGDLVTVSMADALNASFSVTNATVTAVNTTSLTNQTFSYSNTGSNTSGAITDASTVDGGMSITAYSRTNNYTTITVSRAHGLAVGQKIIVDGITDTTINAFKAVVTAVPTTTTLTYSNPGPDTSGSPTNSTLKPIVEYHSTRVSAYQTSATVEGLATSGRPYLTKVISLNSNNEQGESTASSTFFSSGSALEVVGGAIKSPNYVAGTTGWQISSDGSAEFSNVTVRGAITSSTIDIGSGNNSFHVNSSGDIWSGNTTYASAPFRVYRDGTLTASSASISGAITSSTIDIGSGNNSFHVDSSGNMWLGNALLASAPFKVTNTGALTSTSATISGTITGSTITGSSVTATDGVNGLEITSDGYIRGIGGSGVRIKNSDGSTGSTGTSLFGGQVSTGTLYVNFISIDTYNKWNSNGEAYMGGATIRPLSLERNYNAGGAFVRFYNITGGTSGAGVAGSIAYTGGTGQAVVYNATSDARKKENIVNIKNAIEKIKTISPRNFNFIGSNESVDGFVAQELYEVYPRSVTVGGNDPNEEPWMVDYSSLTPILTAALKEAVDKIETLEKKVAQLESI